jgi:hypothetical protein
VIDADHALHDLKPVEGGEHIGRGFRCHWEVDPGVGQGRGKRVAVAVGEGEQIAAEGGAEHHEVGPGLQVEEVLVTQGSASFAGAG